MSTMVDDGRRWRAHGVRAVSTMVDDGGRAGCACRRWSTTAGARGARAPRAVPTMVDDGLREYSGTSVLQIRPAERITAYAAISNILLSLVTSMISRNASPVKYLAFRSTWRLRQDMFGNCRS